MKYQKWMKQVDEISMAQKGAPFFVLCHDVTMPKKAFMDGKKPDEFFVEFVKKVKPCTASEQFTQ